MRDELAATVLCVCVSFMFVFGNSISYLFAPTVTILAAWKLIPSTTFIKKTSIDGQLGNKVGFIEGYGKNILEVNVYPSVGAILNLVAAGLH